MKPAAMAEAAEVRIAPLPSPLLPALVGAVSLLAPALCKCCLLPPGARQGSSSGAAGAPRAASGSLVAKIDNFLLGLDCLGSFGLVFNSNALTLSP